MGPMTKFIFKKKPTAKKQIIVVLDFSFSELCLNAGNRNGPGNPCWNE